MLFRSAELYTRWQTQGDTAARDQLTTRLGEMSTSFGANGGLVLNERGEVVAGSKALVTPPELREAGLRALRSGEVQHTDQYAVAAAAGEPDRADRLHFDVVAPLVATGTPARAAVVLRLNGNEFLTSTMRAWPVPTKTAGTLLVRRDGDDLIGVFGRNRVPLSTPGLLAGRAVRGEVPFGQASTGVDFRGKDVYGVVRPVPGEGWYVVAKIDRAEIHAEVLQDAV